MVFTVRLFKTNGRISGKYVCLHTRVHQVFKPVEKTKLPLHNTCFPYRNPAGTGTGTKHITLSIVSVIVRNFTAALIATTLYGGK